LFFSVFIITHKVNKVRDKYKTKNIKTDGKEVFLATINQSNTSSSSSRNFRLNATRKYKVWLSGSLASPLKKMKSVIIAIAEKEGDKTKASVKLRFILTIETRK